MLWLFTDPARLADPLAAVGGLPKGLCGVVLRQDDPALGARLVKLCKARRLALTVAGDARLAARFNAGVHLRGGRWPGVLRSGGRLNTASAHDGAELRRAMRAGAQVIFLSPAFATASHHGLRALGPMRWLGLATGLPDGRIYALGGVTGGNVRRLGPRVAGAGAIGALSG